MDARLLKYCYGPVPSWRYGRSFGIDVTTPPKKCTYNCIYCQLGSTKKHVVSPDDIKDDLPPTPEIISELRNELQRLDQSTIDAFTFSGTGEPTLNPNLGSIVSAVREMTNNIPIILLSNASLFPIGEVREGVQAVDIVTAKYDAGDQHTLERINRPAKGSYSLQEIEDGIKKLKRELVGSLALEVMLLHGPGGLSNIEGQRQTALIEGILRIDPDIVQIYTPWRPAVSSDVRPVSTRSLKKFGEELKPHFSQEQVWIYGYHDARGEAVRWRAHHTLEDDILALLHRRPCRSTDVALSLGISPATAIKNLERLLIKKRIVMKQLGKEHFYEVNRNT